MRRAQTTTDQRVLIRAVTAATGLSQAALAAGLGVDERTVRRWVSGARRLRGPELRLLRLIVADPSVILRLE